ncbi:MAG: glycosyltransferase [Burkholderiales bacterium]|nr:glycosyltransferase [Burkholderiales bacterium]
MLLVDTLSQPLVEQEQPRLRVLHFGRFHRKYLHSGIERHVDVLLTELSHSIEVENLVANDCWKDETLITAGGYRVYKVSSLGLLASTALAPGLVRRALALQRAQAYDLLHLHFPDPLTHLASMMLPKKVPRVVTWHSDIVRQKFALPLYGPWLKQFLREADAIIVSNPALLQSSPFLAATDPAKCWVIPFGLDYRRFTTADSQLKGQQLRAAFCADRPLVLSVGRLVYYKGFEYLIEAVARLTEVHLVIVGRGPLEHALRKRASLLGCEDRVNILHVDDDDALAAWYNACDVFCLPSVEPAETFGQVQLEAMACGKPVVCTRLGTGVDYVTVDGYTGLVVPPRDVAALREALHRLLSEPGLCQRMGEAGRQRALSEFDAATMARRTLALYRHIVSARQSAA